MSTSLITDCLDKLRGSGRKALIVFITAGDPDLEGTVRITKCLAESGADIIELGVPFSDPVADGPVIQQSSARALSAGTTLTGVLAAVKEIRKDCAVPLVLMGYYNQVYKYGVSRFARDAAAAGVNGIIIPDLPHEESGPLREAASDAGMALIPLVAPTTNEKRLQKILADARGFVYCVSVTGVTGARKNIAADLDALTGKVRRFTSLPLAVGFGIAGPEQAARVAQYCDAVIVGSAVVKIIDSYGDTASALPKVGHFVSEIKAALK